MGQLLHARARTTKEVRREIQLCQESLIKASKKFNVNPKTIAKWRKRDTVDDFPMGPKIIKSTVLSAAEEEVIVKFREMTQLPLDDVLYALQEKAIPHLKRSSLHRCLKRHGCSVLPKFQATGNRIMRKKFKEYPIGFFHIDIAEVRTMEGKMYMYLGVDRTSKFAYAELHKSPTKAVAAEFLRSLIGAVPYKINKILTDNGIQFTNHKHHIHALPHIFDNICHEHKIEHRTTKVKHPWTNGQVERMNRTIKDATVKSFTYKTHSQLKIHLHSYLMAYNFAKHLKALKGKTPWQFIQEQWTNTPKSFTIDPHLFLSGPNS